jgi:hypothetical protein
MHAPSLSLQPKSDVSDFGQPIKWPNSGKPEFGRKRGRGRCGADPSQPVGRQGAGMPNDRAFVRSGCRFYLLDRRKAVLTQQIAACARLGGRIRGGRRIRRGLRAVSRYSVIGFVIGILRYAASSGYLPTLFFRQSSSQSRATSQPSSTQLLRELAAAIKFGRILQFVGGLFLHLDRTHGHLLVVSPKVLVEPAPLVDLQNEIQLFVQ